MSGHTLCFSHFSTAPVQNTEMPIFATSVMFTYYVVLCCVVLYYIILYYIILYYIILYYIILYYIVILYYILYYISSVTVA